MANVPEEDFVIQEIEIVEEPKRAPILESIRCSKCGELVMAPKITYIERGSYCSMCAGKAVPAVIGRGIQTASYVSFRIIK